MSVYLGSVCLDALTCIWSAFELGAGSSVIKFGLQLTWEQEAL